jgi:hypothetical protein
VNLIHSPLHEATGALAGWMASKAIQVDVEPTSDDARSWVLSHEDGDSLLTLRTYPHLDAIGMSFRIELPPAPRLMKLELLAHLNDAMASARFWLDRSGGLVGEYMLDCEGESLPAALGPMVTRMLELPEAVRDVLMAWRLDAAEAPPGAAPAGTALQ